VFVGEYQQSSYDEQSVMWEYWSGKDWRPLYPRDGTHNFAGCGFVEFTAPKVHRKSRRYGDSLYWIRARLEMGGYDEVPVCDRILLNSVYASNYTTTAAVTLGSSQGTPNQSFWFSSGPVLPGQQIVVEEHERPTEEDLKEIRRVEGENAFEDPEGAGFQVRWHEVESLFESGPRNRHYTKDVTSGEVHFGDGVHGMMPPKGDRNIRAVKFRVGGGQHGNVPAGSIVVLENTLSHVDGVSNLFAATGGADLESVDEIKMRGPFMLKNRGRAVTREDFEWLAVQSSNSVARANCIPGHKSEGQVTIVVVPKMSKLHDDFSKKPMPSTELVRRVQAYLDERKLLTTRVNVVKPRYRELSVSVEIMRRSSGSGDRIKREIDERMRTFLHPLKGGREESGWPFGRNLFKVDLYHVVEEVEGVDFVRNISIYDESQKVDVDQIRINENELPFLVNVEITEKAPERIR
jgi:predicted phage baseplate assembly protein